MVGLLLVCHSPEMARGLMALVSQVAGDIPLAAVGGTADGRLGTDPMAVVAAIDQIWSEDGVLVLVDLGSSVMATETALELLTPARAERVQLTGAPFVEGAIAAGIEAKIGRPLARVRAAAEEALNQPKF